MNHADIQGHLELFVHKMVDNFANLLGISFAYDAAHEGTKWGLFEGLSIYINFTGTAQGSYILNMYRESAQKIVGHVLEEEEVSIRTILDSGIIDEVLNTSVGEAIEDLKQNYGFLTFNPPVMNWGVTHVPVFSYASGCITSSFGDISCHFSISPVSLDITEKLITTMHKLKDTERLANIDSLTGLRNRKFYDDYVRHFNMHRALPFSFAIIDLDDFKHINDGFGHATGDSALQHLAKILQESTRDSDLPVRFGGDEFVLIMENTPGTGAEIVLRRICTTLKERPVVHTTGESFYLSVSCGITELSEEDRTFSSLFSRADAQLYRAKMAGKGCVYRDSSSE
ncbi:diguanylate cyclase [Chitinivibrio alkaliphilus]|uniref:diguanylate cyclase n=1 Tax=Chitinivibrio alkaliphilus ACht1 TaxID=1313304 RepID=U7D7S0_9BACT|nr:diguanylate cyclase [Chitinivibrio alkaliphilus]ERP31621.1 diguanylate cyclase/phosphodiesterase [Chitinivibrio alkaliphilus ACht1]